MSVRRNQLIQKMIELQSNRGKPTLINVEETKLFCVMLSDEGWYFDYDFAIGTLSDLYIHQIKTRDNLLDLFMINHYEKKQDEIIEFFKKNHKTRFSIIEKAFIAHKKKQYELSIPVFLTQIEGLFYDLTSKNIYSKRKRENTPAVWINSKESKNFKDTITITLLESLKWNENISANFIEAGDYPNVLNRNRILHGRDLDYPSELNSYKAISLLWFVGLVVFDLERDSNNISKV